MTTTLLSHRYDPSLTPRGTAEQGGTVSLGGQRRSLAGYFDLKKSPG
jgi:hypothetical protein